MVGTADTGEDGESENEEDINLQQKANLSASEEVDTTPRELCAISVNFLYCIYIFLL